MENKKNKILKFFNPSKKSSVSPQRQNIESNDYHYYEHEQMISALDLSQSPFATIKYTIGAPITTFSSSSSSSSSPSSSFSSSSYSYPPSPTNCVHPIRRGSQEELIPQTKNQTAISDNESNNPVHRVNSMQRRYSFSNTHENSKKKLLRAKKIEYEEKMRAFDELINKRRGSNLRTTLHDIATY